MLSMTNANIGERAVASFQTIWMFAARRKRALPEGTRNESFHEVPATGDCPALLLFFSHPPLQPLFSWSSCPPVLDWPARPRPPRPTRTPPPPPTGAPGWSGTSGLVPLPVHGASTPVPLVIGFAQQDLTCPAPWAGIPRTLHQKHRTTAGPTITHPNPLPTTASLPFSVLRLHNNPHPPPSTKLAQLCQTFRLCLSQKPIRSRTIDTPSTRRRLCSPPETDRPGRRAQRTQTAKPHPNRLTTTAPKSSTGANSPVPSIKQGRQNPPSVQS